MVEGICKIIVKQLIILYSQGLQADTVILLRFEIKLIHSKSSS